MLPKEQFRKIAKALDNGSLKLKELSDAEYEKAEKRWRNAKAQEAGQRQPQRILSNA